MVDHETMQTRRILVVAALTVALLGLTIGAPHRGEHAVQNLLVPGLGLTEQAWALAALVFVSFVGALVLWLRWGADWLPGAVVAASTVSAALAAPGVGHVSDVSAAAHQFPVVAVLVSGLASVTTLWRSLPRLSRGSDARSGIETLSAIERCQLALLQALVEADPGPRDERVERRARRIDAVARFRFGPVRSRDHGPARAAMLVSGGLDSAQHGALLAEAQAAPGGVVASEPGWVRLLDGTLTAIALDRHGDTEALARWDRMLGQHLEVRRGHRPESWWTPLGVRVGKAPAWEHATATALATAAGCGAARDWSHLRQATFAAAARGTTTPARERLVAAGRIWAELEDDDEARRVLSRPTIDADPIAMALNAIAHDQHNRPLTKEPVAL